MTTFVVVEVDGRVRGSWEVDAEPDEGNPIGDAGIAKLDPVIRWVPNDFLAAEGADPFAPLVQEYALRARSSFLSLAPGVESSVAPQSPFGLRVCRTHCPVRPIHDCQLPAACGRRVNRKRSEVSR